MRPERDPDGRPAPAVGVRRIHHVAYASADGAAEDALSRLFGLAASPDEHGPGFAERTCGVGEGGASLQLLRETGPGTVARFVARRGPALHHVAFEVDDLDATLARLRAEGVRLVDEAARPGGGGTRIAFVHPTAVGGLLVELVETMRCP